MSTRVLLSQIFLIATLLFSLSAKAQHQQAKDTLLNRTVVVEQQYNPNINDAQKVNVMPDPRDFTAPPTQVEYDRNATPATVIPGTTMSAYMGEENQAKANSGYVRAGYGNKGNLDLEGSYMFPLGERDYLNVSASLQGMDGKVHASTFENRWDSRFYRTKAGADYIHRFDNVDFGASYNFGLANYNHFSYSADHSNSRRNTTNDLSFNVKTTDRSLPLQFSAEAGVKTFNASHNPYYKTQGHLFETEVFVKADFLGEISSEQMIGLALDFNRVMYNTDAFKNYNTIQLNPYYTWSDYGWKIRLGANVDLATSYGKKFYVSPDVKVEYTIVDGYVFYANATGGRMLNDLRAQEANNPYGVFGASYSFLGLVADQYESSYERINSVIGFKMSPTNGLWFNLYGGYRNVRNDLYNYTIPAYSSQTPAAGAVFFGLQHTSNYVAGLQVDYAYKNFFNFMIKGQIYNWDTRNNDEAMYYKAKSRFDMQLNLRVMAPLLVNVNYEYVKRHDAYGSLFGQFADKNINNLSVGANYDIFKGVDIYVRVSNLFDRKFEHYASAPMSGINYLGGLIFNF